MLCFCMQPTAIMILTIQTLSYSAYALPVTACTVRRVGISEIASERQEVESNVPLRTPTLPNGETQRGKEHSRKATKREGM